MLRALAVFAVLGLAGPETTPAPATFEQLRGFGTVVDNHVSVALGRQNLPPGTGVPVEPALLVTMPLDRVQLFDRDVLQLAGGRLTDPTIAAECKSGCPALFFDAFQQAWLEHAVEASTFAVEIPARVVFAVHKDLPALTLVQAAYAAAETRPASPPFVSVLVNSDRAGLRAQPFFLIPPRGLELRAGSAALGLTIDVSPGRWVVSSADARNANRTEMTSLPRMQAFLRDLKKRYPGKEAVILVPDANVTVGELMRLVAVLLPQFPRIVFSRGQDVIVP